MKLKMSWKRFDFQILKTTNKISLTLNAIISISKPLKNSLKYLRLELTDPLLILTSETTVIIKIMCLVIANLPHNDCKVSFFAHIFFTVKVCKSLFYIDLFQDC